MPPKKATQSGAQTDSAEDECPCERNGDPGDDYEAYGNDGAGLRSGDVHVAEG